VFWEPVHWLMQTRQFAILRRRAERDLQPAADNSLLADAAVPAAVR